MIDTIRLILPALVSLVFSILLIWILASVIKSNVDKDAKPFINKFAWFITLIAGFLSIWWLVTLLTVNNIPRATIDRTLNDKMRNSFEDRMISDTTKKHK